MGVPPRRHAEGGGATVEVLHERCAGLDVHKKSVVACAMWSGPAGTIVTKARTFGTMTADLEQLAEWLAAQGCGAVAMEATGAYWKPVYNVLEARGGFTLVVANAEHLRAVPGRKTDVKDAEWLATLLRHGLVRPSFIPDRAQRELRELTRYRTALVRERADEVNRLQKTLEGANIKLASVLSDVTGVSGQRILEALVAGRTDPEELADLAHARLRKKRAELERAVVGRLDGVPRFVVERQLAHLRDLDRLIAECDAEVAERLRPFAAELERLDGIPGIGPRTAQVFLVEVGPDVSHFPSARHLAAWAGLCPGNKASGGKRRPARTRQGNPWLKAALTEAAWGASRRQGGYLAAQFRRLAGRRGRKRALVAVGHSIAVIAYHLLARGATFEDLGGAYFDERDREARRQGAVGQLEALGYRVELTERAKAS
jgi:transposase